MRMGAFFSHIWWGGDPDSLDAKSGLSKRDIHHVRTSWAIVNKDPVGNGTELLRRLFKTFPETKTFFRMLDGVNEADYHNNYQFKAHVLKLMSSLFLVFENLHQPEVAIAMLEKLGEAHNKRKIKKKHFNAVCRPATQRCRVLYLNLSQVKYDRIYGLENKQLKDVLVKMLIEVLGLTQDKLVSWDRTVNFMYLHIFNYMDQD